MKTLKIVSARIATYAPLLAIITALLVSAVPFRVSAADSLLVNRSDRLQKSLASAVTTHLFGFTMAVSGQQVGSISFEFCTNSPVIGDPCTTPAGFSASSAVLAAQSGDVGFSIHASSTANRIILF
jgi:hypothetical protein